MSEQSDHAPGTEPQGGSKSGAAGGSKTAGARSAASETAQQYDADDFDAFRHWDKDDNKPGEQEPSAIRFWHLDSGLHGRFNPLADSGGAYWNGALDQLADALAGIDQDLDYPDDPPPSDMPPWYSAKAQTGS